MSENKKIYLKKILIFNAALIASVAITWIVLSLMSRSGLFFCIFKVTTGLYCPGCGGTRAVGELLSFHPLKSFKINPIPIILIIYISYYEVSWIQALFAGKTVFIETKQYRIISYVLSILLAVFIVLFFIIRNFLLVKYHIDPIGDFYPPV